MINLFDQRVVLATDELEGLPTTELEAALRILIMIQPQVKFRIVQDEIENVREQYVGYEKTVQTLSDIIRIRNERKEEK